MTVYSMHLDAFMYSESFHGAPYVYHAQHVTAYAKMICFEGICSGKATYIDVITYLCSNDSIAVYDATYTTHTVSFQGLATSVGATVLAGDWPHRNLNTYRLLSTGGMNFPDQLFIDTKWNDGLCMA
ncbi:hypothetical protein DFH08DRAFT_801713 [Mycena albidolilacea]|uniref:Uncharacterized protein n=1 Tax=Mycena albidolilacea TaxID=1033008 RepID=A0AAD7AJ44_9AGAR|nr:hypothetical protein DFH08DRAFT_801713 [Mycena albidolilacea]